MSTMHANESNTVVSHDRLDTRSRPERRTFTETKLGVKTSEFYLTIIGIAAVLIATYVDGDDSLVLDDGWRIASFIAIAYIVSRGLAKLGTREPYDEDRTN